MKYSGFEKEQHFDRFSFYNGDCMDLLKQTPDKYYDLCIVEPPYGIGISGQKEVQKGKKSNRKLHVQKTGIMQYRSKNILMNYSVLAKIK